MAELTNPSSSRQGSSGRSSKTVPRVDLTAMVDLAFLLITFFMLTTSLAKNRSLPVAMPDDTSKGGKISEKRTLTLYLGDNDRLGWYTGMPDHPLSEPATTTYGRQGIRKLLLDRSAAISKTTGKSMVVLVKPGVKSTLKNLVDVLDELEITQVRTYAIAEVLPAERKLFD